MMNNKATLIVQTFADFRPFTKLYVCEMFQNRPSAQVNVDKIFQKQCIPGYGKKKEKKRRYKLVYNNIFINTSNT